MKNICRRAYGKHYIGVFMVVSQLLVNFIPDHATKHQHFIVSNFRKTFHLFLEYGELPALPIHVLQITFNKPYFKFGLMNLILQLLLLLRLVIMAWTICGLHCPNRRNYFAVFSTCRCEITTQFYTVPACYSKSQLFWRFIILKVRTCICSLAF